MKLAQVQFEQAKEKSFVDENKIREAVQAAKLESQRKIDEIRECDSKIITELQKENTLNSMRATREIGKLQKELQKEKDSVEALTLKMKVVV
jgi:hypothetical protein